MKRSMCIYNFRPDFFEPMPPSRHAFRAILELPVINHEVIGASGRSYPVGIIGQGIDDLYDNDLLTYDDHHSAIEALQNHMRRGIMPGLTRFYSVYSGERVYFTEMVDDVAEMYTLAMNFWDLTDDESENEEPDGVTDLWTGPFRASNIGAMRMYNSPDTVVVSMRVFHDALDRSTDETDDTTMESGENTTEN